MGPKTDFVDKISLVPSRLIELLNVMWNSSELRAIRPSFDSWGALENHYPWWNFATAVRPNLALPTVLCVFELCSQEVSMFFKSKLLKYFKNIMCSCIFNLKALRLTLLTFCSWRVIKHGIVECIMCVLALRARI